MFLNTRQTARESLTDEEAFLELELGVLEDFASTDRDDLHPLRNQHLQYLAELHFRGESAVAMGLIERFLDSPSNPVPAAAGTVELSELLILKAAILGETGTPAEAEAVLVRALGISVPPRMTCEIAIRLANVLSGDFRKAEALTVLQGTHDSLAPGTRPAELVTSLAAAHVGVDDFPLAEELLRVHIRQLQDSPTRPRTEDSALCRVYLASLLLEQGKCTEIEDLLRPVSTSGSQVGQALVNLACYYEAVCAAAMSGSLLSDCLRSSPFLSQSEVDHESLRLFGTFAWIRPSLTSEVKLAPEPRSGLEFEDALLGDLFRSHEFSLQGSAYRRLAEGDFGYAADEFRALEELRTKSTRQGNLLAALDMVALAFALNRAGRSGSLDAVRCARRSLQLLLGLSSVGALRAVLDEARILMDQDDPAPARALVRKALARKPTSYGGQEVILRLRLVLMEINTRTGLAYESLQSISELKAEAAVLSAPDLLPIIQYQAAAAMAADGDFDAAEHEFDALRCALESAENVSSELAFKATYGLARVMQRRGEYVRALSLLRPLLETSPGASRPLSLRVRRRIAACLTSMHENAGAADVYRSCADDLNNWAGPRDLGYLQMRLAQADSLIAAGQYKQARKIYHQVWEAKEDDYSGLEVVYVRSAIGHATCLRRLGDYAGAVDYYRRAINLGSLQLSHEDALNLQRWLAWSLEMSNASSEAVQHYDEAIRLAENLCPPPTHLVEDLKFRRLCCSG